jgi:hypothetical protein
VPTALDNGRRSPKKLLRAVAARRSGGSLTEDLPTFDEFVDELRRRLGAADALKPSELHDFHELMSDYAGTVGENWYSDAFDELELRDT